LEQARPEFAHAHRFAAETLAQEQAAAQQAQRQLKLEQGAHTDTAAAASTAEAAVVTLTTTVDALSTKIADVEASAEAQHHVAAQREQDLVSEAVSLCV
jgi:hypothetical protein